MVEFRDGHKTSHGGREGPSFGEIVGQRELKEALLAVAANDALDGVLLRGEKGTAKSTAVRALRDLLPTQRAIADCPYGCSPDPSDTQCSSCRDRADPPVEERPVPLVTLPLGATRENVLGSLSVASALDGTHEFDPGLLARANRGILYVDEVNLLDDHLVDVVLDAAASGVNRVERDGVSVTHPASFTLVGTMNPEEGDLRPQLRDRFALQATVTGCTDLDDRVTIIERAVVDGKPMADDDGPATSDYRAQLQTARDRLADVSLSPAFAREIAELCRDAGVEGHRADIATARAARTLAALDDRPTVLERDVRRAAALALPHRLQAQPFEDAPDTEDVLADHFDGEPDDPPADDDGAESSPDAGADDADRRDGATDEGPTPDGPGDSTESKESPEGATERQSGRDEGTETGEADSKATASAAPGDGEGRTADGHGGERDEAGDPGPSGGMGENGASDDDEGTAAADGGDEGAEAAPAIPGTARAPVGDSRPPTIDPPEADGDGSCGSGSQPTASASTTGDGPRRRTAPATAADRIDVGASVRAASRRGSTAVESRDLRQSVRQSPASTLVVFAVDASASMQPAMRAAKGTVLELLEDAYQQRDEVAFVAFAGDDAEVLLPPTDSVTLAARHLKDLPTGDRTPLPAGLRTARTVIDRADPAASVVVIVTDGRANVADESPVDETRAAARALAGTDASVIVVDAGDGGRAGLVDVVADVTDGTHVGLDALTADRVDAVAGAASQTEVE